MFVALSALYFSGHGLNSDEGLVLNSAWQLWHGKKLYIDYFEYVSPGASYLILGSWKLFGDPSYLVAKLFSYMFWLFSLAGLIAVIRQFTKSLLAISVAVVLWLLASYLYPIINHNTYSSFAAVWLMYALIRATKTQKTSYWLVCGVLSVVVFWFLQTKGLLLVVSSVGIFVLQRNRRLLDLLAMVVGSMATMVVLFHPWPWRVLWEYLFIYLMRGGYMSFTSMQIHWIILECLIVVAMIGLAYFAKRRELMYLAVLQAGLFLSSGNNVDVNHLAINSFPFIVVVAVLCARVVEVSRNNSQTLLRFAVAVGVVVAMQLSFVVLSNLASNNVFNKDLAGADATEILGVSTLGVRNIYSGPFLPGVAYELRKPNPFPYSNQLVCDAECLNATLSVFEKERPELVFMDYGMVAKYGYLEDNPVGEYVRKHYKVCGEVIRNLQVYAIDNCPALGELRK